jgi:uncharacterized delta-60 repeat protein
MASCSSSEPKSDPAPRIVCTANCDPVVGPVDAGVGADGAPLPPVTELTITIDPAKVTVAQARSVDIGVTILRPAGYIEALALEATDLPPGSIATMLTVPYDQTNASVRITLGANTPQGSHPAKIVVRGATRSANAPVTFDVIGSPGAIDTTFGPAGANGRATAALPTKFAAIALGRQANGSIVLAGQTGVTPARDIGVIRFGADGAFDTTFGTSGLGTLDFGGDDIVYDMLVEPNDRIVCSGYQTSASAGAMAFARFDPTGKPDPDFGASASGKLLVPGPASFAYAYGIARQGDGKFVASAAVFNGTDWDVGAMRLTDKGAADTTFATNGYVTAQLGSHEYPLGVAFDSTGRIIETGERWNGTGYDFFVARFTAAGTVQTTPDTFKTDNGWLNVVSGGAITAYGQNIAVQQDGKMLFAGAGPGTGSDFVIFRFNNDGTPDASFGNAGKFTFNRGPYDRIDTMRFDAQGRIVFIGSTGTDPGSQVIVGRILPTGTFDSSFGSGGLATLSFTPGGSDYGTGLDVQSDGRIVAAGFSRTATSDAPWIVRLWP